MFNHPSRVYRLLLPGVVVAFAVSGAGKGTPSTGGLRYWIGAGGWAAFGVLLVITLLYSVAVALRKLTSSRTATTTK
jgi:hypothetical protein